MNGKSVDDLLEGVTDQWEVRRILTKDLTTRYNNEGLDAWNKHYATQPSYRLVRDNWNELMVAKAKTVYGLALKELQGD